MLKNIGMTAATIFVLAIVVLLAFSPMTDGFFDSDNDALDDIIGLLALAGSFTAAAVVSISGIIASCLLARRLGYDQLSGLLLLIPIVNVIVFFYWAFRESPTEQQLRTLKQRKNAGTEA